MTSVDRESDDIFARNEETDYEDSYNNDELDDDDEAYEITAAVALTSLVASEASHTHDRSTDTKSQPEEEDLQIPQRFTKSGRKRAVSFPLKVRQTDSCFIRNGSVPIPLKCTHSLFIPIVCSLLFA